MDVFTQFRRSIYEEHRDEAAALYQLCLTSIDDLAVGLDFVRETEDRIEAHLDGLLLGGDLARKTCVGSALEEPGCLYAATRLLLRYEAKDDLERLLNETPGDDPALARAWSDALAEDLPKTWAAWVNRQLSADPAKAARVCARAVGSKRLAVAPTLLEVGRTHPGLTVDLLWAIARTANAELAPQVAALMQSSDPAVAQAAGCAALRLGMTNLGAQFASALSRSSWCALPLALCAGPSGFAHLSRQAQTRPEAGVVLALGLLGDTKAVPLLLELLAEPSAAQSAALALELLSGATLGECVAPAKAAQAPADEGDSAVAVEDDEDLAEPAAVVRLSQDRAQWTEWLEQHAAAWPKGARVQLGAAAGIDSATRAFQHKVLPSHVRALLADELFIRYGVDVPFNPDWPSRPGPAELRGIFSRIRGNAFAPGRWYLAGAQVN